jgi:tetratricopeptide (TPR) repeat protein
VTKKFLTGVRTFAKNVRFHAKRVVARNESASEALQMLRQDSKKLANMLTPSEVLPENRKHAQKLVDKGRERFNAKDYEAAEKLFRGALAEDPECGWACTFLGHALYHQGRHKDAIAVWQRAYQMDPVSDAGLKAKKKLDHVQRTQTDYIAAYQERMGRK